jgi:hypothetical protein
MRIVLLLLVSFALASSFRVTSSRSPKLKCVLYADCTEYKVGEVPKLQVRIINESNEDVYMIGSLDGSDVKWRMPYCYFTIQKPVRDSVGMVGRCGNTNPLTATDFVRVKRGGSFDPYQVSDDRSYGFFSDHEIGRPENFRNPGVYKIRFHYNSNSGDIDAFDGRFNQLSKDSVEVCNLFPKAMKVELTSNEIEIKFVK